MLAAIVRTCQQPEGHWKLCEHEFANISTHVFLKHRCPQGVAGCWPSAMMLNARPCALVTHRAVEVDLSRGVESRHTVILRSLCTKLSFWGWMLVENFAKQGIERLCNGANPSAFRT